MLVRQIATDTVVEMMQHPLKNGWFLVTEPVAHLRAAADGVVYKRLVPLLTPEPDPLLPCRPTLDPSDLELELKKLTANDLQPVDVRMFVDGAAALVALDQVIEAAVCRIDVLMYLWDNDSVGLAIAERLAAAATPTRRVRVLVDGGGNLIHSLPRQASAVQVNQVVCWLANQPHVEVIRTRNAFARFDHRKLVVADGRVAWSGGRNFTAPSFFEDHDLSFTLAGPLVAEIETVFEESWRDQGGAHAPAVDAMPCCSSVDARARLVRTRPGHRQLAQAVYAAVDRASHHVYVENQYLTDSRLFAKLVQARRRGADVRVVLTIHSDSLFVDRANRVIANRLLREGVRVYLYPGMTHVKATVVDGCWAYLGTGNFDALSLRYNRELGVAIATGAVITALEENLFLPDFRPEWEMSEPLPLSPADYAFEMLNSLLL